MLALEHARLFMLSMLVFAGHCVGALSQSCTWLANCIELLVQRLDRLATYLETLRARIAVVYQDVKGLPVPN